MRKLEKFLCWLDSKSVLVFTDGASEGDVHTVACSFFQTALLHVSLALTFLDFLLTSGSPL